MAACPRLTELSVISPYPFNIIEETDTEVQFDPDGSAHSGMSKLIVACKALQDFNTLQIVRLPVMQPSPRCDCNVPCEYFHYPCVTVERWEQSLEKHVKDLGEWAIECLEKAKMGYLEGEERKRITVRTVEFGYIHPVKVKEYQV